MFGIHFKLALRNLSKNKLYAAINIAGLAVSIAASLLIFRLVHYELSFNGYHSKGDRIVRIYTASKNPNTGESKTCGIPIPAMDAMQESVPQFEAFARLHETWPTITVSDASGRLSDRKFNTDEDRELGIFTEASFFKIFDWPWLVGDPETALSEPNSVVLNRRTAEKCFDTWQAAMGKTVMMDNALLLTVRGVVENAPDNSDFPFHVIVSYKTLVQNPDQYFYSKEWGSTSTNNQAYALLHDAGQFDAAAAALATVGKEEYHNNKPGESKWHSMQRLSEVHYDSDLGSTGTHSVEKSRLWILSMIGLLVLVMACFNFINLATALAARRSREVGVRKSLGGSRGQLTRQFMAETSLIVVLSVAAGAIMAFLLSPLLKYVSDVPDALPFFSNPVVWLFLLLTVLLVSLFSGLYPALVLAGFNPVEALKNRITNRSVGGVSLRKSLVVLQFAIAQALLIGTMVTISQLDYIRNKDLGFTPNLVYNNTVASDSISAVRFDTYRQRLMQVPGVESVSFASDQPSSGNTWSSNFAMGRGSEDAPVHTSLKFCDPEYFDTYGLRMVAGRFLSPSDTLKEAVVNETMLRKLGINDPAEVVGKELRLGRKMLPVVGVVEDFHSHSVHEEMEALTLCSRREYYNVVGIKIRPQDMAGTTKKIRQVFDEVFPEQVFDGRYYDETIAEFYRDENRFSMICKGFALLAILISCLGLFGLASLMAIQKTKEIGIRKVLGASVGSVVGLLSRDFLLLVVVAFLIAAPAAWWSMRRWLDDFVYRIDIGWQVFVFTVLLAVLIAFITISFQALRAALANPVKALRSE
ncbi:MAG: ABC transporter permease [Saprospiraceae bacterium]|nr:ABC transporter permease [Saprospiraceae bacterium]MCB0542959.1 ABC transporter permease [Saprospiraceae bacterium]MCB0574020.1 ABC transporter permease [Saprospiraceae bacterium]MCB9356007.1 ABC transporter permease [Lewinellaceae bacterium]